MMLANHFSFLPNYGNWPTLTMEWSTRHPSRRFIISARLVYKARRGEEVTNLLVTASTFRNLAV
jgi:hypothetical protein